MSQSLLTQLIDLQGHTFLWLQIYSTTMFFGLCFVAGLITRTPVTAKPPADRVTDMYYWLLAPAVRMLARVIVAGLLFATATLLGREISPALFKGFGPVAQQPSWLLAIELLMVMDLSSYWTHRLFHTVPFLWRFHAIHHSATKIRWSTTARVHPINEFFNYALGIVPAFLLGFPIGMVLAMIPILAWYAIAAHTDWNPSYGPLSRIFASPRFHRWHHTMSHEGGNKNFSNVFSLWDLLFGSYYLPQGRMPEVFGLDDGYMPERYLTQLAAPFRSQPLLPNDPTSAPQAVEEHAPKTPSSAPSRLRSAS
ncbi:MAG TPA: sterol desaturase family protein [Polyangiales bacterium]|jgi:sterol desaturase/sphingolipid hydroxylase (fatty acid hydroxylase superfamily)|nr:sterol desaturase family protein [Polyangiales bacterium]